MSGDWNDDEHVLFVMLIAFALILALVGAGAAWITMSW